VLDNIGRNEGALDILVEAMYPLLQLLYIGLDWGGFTKRPALAITPLHTVFGSLVAMVLQGNQGARKKGICPSWIETRQSLRGELPKSAAGVWSCKEGFQLGKGDKKLFSEPGFERQPSRGGCFGRWGSNVWRGRSKQRRLARCVGLLNDK